MKMKTREMEMGMRMGMGDGDNRGHSNAARQVSPISYSRRVFRWVLDHLFIRDYFHIHIHIHPTLLMLITE